MTRSDPLPPCIRIPGEARPIYLPRRSRRQPAAVWRPHDGPILPEWQAAAAAKGFRVLRRIRDRQTVLLECLTCQQLTAQRSFTLKSARLACAACPDQDKHAQARAAGMEFLAYDAEDRHYGLFRAPCGHELRRQFGEVKDIALGRKTCDCEACRAEVEEAEAAARGWARIGPDPEGDANYRLYAHVGGCGCEARIARVNMQTGRFTCPGCGESWATAPSFLYAMRFCLVDGLVLMKLGFSRDPDSRLRFQLLSGSSARGELLRTVPMPSGREALNTELALHARLAREVPDAVVPLAHYADEIKVTSEIYTAGTEALILRLLDEVATGAASGSGPGSGDDTA